MDPGRESILDRMALAVAMEELSEEPCASQTALQQMVLHQSMAASAALASSLLSSVSATPTRVFNFVEETVPMYSPGDFRSHFRMTRSTFEELHMEMGPFLKTKKIQIEKKLLATVWLLANQESFRGVADRFGISKGNLHYVISEVCSIISSHRDTFIKFPRGDLQATAHGFEERCGFPGVVGAIDGTHIAIPGPSDHRDSYINRKGFPSIQLQVVCDSKLFFTDVYVGWPGAVHDARVFRNCPLSHMLERNGLPSDMHLLGDSAYPLKTYLLVPFKDNGHLSPTQKKFNKLHSSTRVDVERAIGLLKCKFRRLKHLDMRALSELPMVVVTACVLHNFILEKESLLDEDLQNAALHVEDWTVNNHVANDGQPIVNAQQKRNDVAELFN